MTDHLLTVDSLHSKVTVVCLPASVAGLRSRLDRTFGEVLPPLLADATRPVLDRYDGVVRLRRLTVRLDVGDFDEGSIARLLAARIAAALGEAMSRADDEVCIWPDHKAYLTSYVENVLALEPGHAWAFDEFRALKVLAPSEAAIEVLRARPELLASLARSGARTGAPARLTTVLDNVSCAALLDAVLGGPGAPTPEDVLALDVEASLAPLTRDAIARASLSMAMRTLARRTGPTVAGQVRAAVAVAVATALPLLWRRLLAVDSPSTELSDALAQEAPELSPLVRSTALATAREPVLRTAVASVLRPRDAQTQPGPRQEEARHDGQNHPIPVPRRTGTQTLASPVAGVALLLPGAARHGRALTVEQVRAVLLCALGEEAQRGAALDPLVTALLPADARAGIGVVPDIPSAVIGSLVPEARSLVTASDPISRWAEVLLADLAGRLPGLTRSSPGYLRRQFLHVPGRLSLTDDSVTVTLEGPPLAVVLAMAGLNGDQGRLVHLGGRSLSLVLTGLRR